MPAHQLVDTMLDLTWTERPHLRVEIHASLVTALLLAADRGTRYRGCEIVDDLQTDQHVIIRESARGGGWLLVGNLHTGYITEAPAIGA